MIFGDSKDRVDEIKEVFLRPYQFLYELNKRLRFT